jgi:hypothetical protein
VRVNVDIKKRERLVMLAKTLNEFKDSSHLVAVIRHMGILPQQHRATPTGFTPIPCRKNLLGALGAYAVYIALEPYYDDLRITHVNGAGVDLIGFKNGVAEYIEVKNWRQRYTTGPSLTPNKFKSEVRTRFPLRIKHRKILVTSATWSSETGFIMKEDDIYPYQYIHQITNPQTFKEAIAEIRYQHELRLWREEEERRLFNIGMLQQPGDVVDAYYYESDVDDDDNYSLNEGNNLHYFGPSSTDFYLDTEPLHRRRQVEMEIYTQMVYPVPPWTIKWLNQLKVYNQIHDCENWR